MISKINTVKKILLSGLMVLITICLYAQDSVRVKEQQEPKKFDRSRLFVGGNFGLSFGNYTWINISPQVGYRFSEYFAAGIGINGQYSKEKTNYSSYSTTSTYGVAGMNLFGRFYPIRQVFAQLQPELNYIWGTYDNGNSKSSLNGKILPSLLLGAGAVIPMGRSGGLMITGQYDVLNKASYYPDPGTPYGKNIFFSIGFTVGL